MSFSSPLYLLEGHPNLSLALDDGLEIFSANEVCRFLCGETGNEGFYGADPTHQALVDYWLGWEASELKVCKNGFNVYTSLLYHLSHSTFGVCKCETHRCYSLCCRHKYIHAIPYCLPSLRFKLLIIIVLDTHTHTMIHTCSFEHSCMYTMILTHLHTCSHTHIHIHDAYVHF